MTNTVSRSDLSRKTKRVMEHVAESGFVVVTHQGRPEAVIQPIDQDRVLSLVVDNVDELVEARKEAYRALDDGDFVTSDELFDGQ